MFDLIDLSRNTWSLSGWRPNQWRLRPALVAEPTSIHQPDIGPVRAAVPGSTYTALREAGIIPDWNIGTHSNACEWLEHRHWEFSTDLEPVPPRTPVFLEAEGLDHSGWVLIDLRIVADFEGSLVRHQIHLTDALSDGRPHRLSIIFDEPPREQGQIGFTSRSRHFKPRFSYSWDWCPRIVPVGIWDRIALRRGVRRAQLTRLRAHLDEDLSTGRVEVILDDVVLSASCATVELRDGARVIAAGRFDLRPGHNDLSLDVRHIEPWFPNGMGPQRLYDLHIAVDEQEIFGGAIGFKRIRWLACQGAPADAEPWICQVNGREVFLQGVNWTPVSADYAGAGDAEYARLIDLYRQMGCNLLRVWGGAFLEKHVFYDLCDRAGLMVWQEFPLSSSGVENCAPDDPAIIEKLCTIATDYIRRRGHHVCKLLWCGGNELFGEKDRPGGRPHDRSHPAMAALAGVVEREDPGTRFVPTSPSGPSFSGDAKNFGQGVHHDTHGPWDWHDAWEALEAYWRGDDSLFRSEVGMPGASPVDVLERYRGPFEPWPANRDNPYWRHSAGWWIQWHSVPDSIRQLSAAEGLPRFVEWSQRRQADALRLAASACKRRFPRCGGFLIWMGHDCFPCPANTSIIDFLRRPKPAWHALREVFIGSPAPHRSPG